MLKRGAKNEIQKLERGMDFRRTEYRREVFLRFYEFSLRYRVQPGAVHYVIPALVEEGRMDREDRLWFLFIAANTMNLVTAWVLWKRFPRFTRKSVSGLIAFVGENYDNLNWNIDRRYDKSNFAEALHSYELALKPFGHRATEFYDSKLTGNAETELNFERLWTAVREKFATFGRMTTFSFFEQLRVAGEPLDCSSLFLEDKSGSRSTRNGLIRVLGRDDMDQHRSNPDYKPSGPEIAWMVEEGHILLKEARNRLPKKLLPDATCLTLESSLCCYKGWFRKNRRYPNVYSDILYDCIKYAEQFWPAEDFWVFWKLRNQALPPYLRVEDNPEDPGVCPLKQNHFLNTGQVIMMDWDWPEFKNDFNDGVRSGSLLFKLGRGGSTGR